MASGDPTPSLLRNPGVHSARNSALSAASRWTGGAGVVKALHPFAKLGGKHRSFIEIHLAKSRRTARASAMSNPSTSWSGTAFRWAIADASESCSGFSAAADWMAIGAALSARTSFSYRPFSESGQELRPGNEVRVRAGVEGPVAQRTFLRISGIFAARGGA